MTHRGINTRNEALEFARRARQNLEFIEQAAAARPADGSVHVITQLTLSLLGMVVFPKEKLLLDSIEAKTLAGLAKDGWPTWLITRDQPRKPEDTTDTLGKLLRHVRNAVAHGRITFTSDSPRPEDVRRWWKTSTPPKILSLTSAQRSRRQTSRPSACASLS